MIVIGDGSPEFTYLPKNTKVMAMSAHIKYTCQSCDLILFDGCIGALPDSSIPCPGVVIAHIRAHTDDQPCICMDIARANIDQITDAIRRRGIPGHPDIEYK
jgi:hypothetical protein